MPIKLSKMVLIALVCFYFLPCLSLGQPRVKLESLEKLVDEDRIAEALTFLPQISAQYSNHPIVLYLNGIEQKDGERSFQYFSRIYEHHKDSDYADDALFKIAQLYYARGKYDDARSYFSLLARSFPQSRLKDDAQYLFCQTYLAQGKSDSAATFLRAFIDNSPRSPFVDFAITDMESNLPRTERSAAPGKDRSSPPSMHRYSVQIGAFSNRDNARKVSDRLKKEGYDVEIIEKRQGGKTLYAVWMGKFETKVSARNFAEKFYKKYSMDYKIIDRNE